jgi:hypothetical protein
MRDLTDFSKLTLNCTLMHCDAWGIRSYLELASSFHVATSWNCN